MYSPLRLAQKYLRYYLTAANGKGHGIHSPFVFDFVTNVLNDRQAYPAYKPIEQLRHRLRKDNTTLQVEDRGAGSAYGPSHTRSIASIVKNAAKPPRLGQLLHRVAAHYHPATIVELGTSLGLSTAYLAAGAPRANIHTIEGVPAIAAAAGRNLDSLHLHPTILTGSFDEVLPSLLPALPPIDLAFIDGNHRHDPTLRYFEQLLRHASPSSVLIFDDIHWSAEMETAWNTIKKDPRVYLTVDLFFLGFVFRRDDFKVKQDFIIQF
ncbi:class I SAM-dependent methyltransferase [Puia sp.]|uniref:O-methyltransferase n=1 Tax=Puia sp. TaxID=2045100 RepID=UPI002F42A5B8